MLERSPDTISRLAQPGDSYLDTTGRRIDLGLDPPLDPVGLSTPAGDRRAISVRWLTGSILTGLSGAILITAAIYVSFEGDTTVAELPEAVSPAATRSTDGAARRGDRLVKNEPVTAAKQSFKSPMSLRVGDREVIKVRPFVRIATALSLTSGQYATDIPKFNPTSLFAEGSDSGERIEALPDTNDADISIVKLDLMSYAVGSDAPALSEEQAAAQVSEAKRAASEAGRHPVIPLPPQLLAKGARDANALGGAFSYATSNDNAFSTIEVRVVPENVTVMGKVEPQKDTGVEERLITLKRGETLELALKANGASPEETRSILMAISSFVKPPTLPEGQRVKLLIAPGPNQSGERQIVRVMLVDETAIKAIAAVDDRGVFVSVAPPESEDKAVTGKPKEETEEDEDDGSGTRLYESLYETAMKNDIPRSAVEDLIRVFAYDVDFQKRVSGGDTFEVFYAEDEDTPGRLEILYAALNTGGEQRQVYRFQSLDDGSVEYFDQDGKSLKKFLLRKPIADAELRSGFGMRYHPILRYSKMHTGVDWGSKVGTPILASGNGVVTKVGWTSGYGRHTEVQHTNGYVTTYSHQSAFAKSIVPGAKVRQGQVIGFVGSTGLSTGPHLHYEVLVNGHFVNPMKIKVPRGRELDGRALAEFNRQRDQVNTLMAKAANTKVAAQ
jgi:murein DD-endopeptidase MepM/ murein hydrolase activator NlpD